MKYLLVFITLLLFTPSLTIPLYAQPEPYIVSADSTDIFGYIVDIEGDQAMVLRNTLTRNAIHAYKKDGSSWTQVDELEAPQGDASQIFGYAFDMQEEYVVVGAPGYTYNGASDAGIAYIFMKSGDDWSSSAVLTPQDIDGHDDFGTDVAIDGDAVIIGSPLDDDRGGDSGSAYIFRKAGEAWIEEAKLGPTDGQGAGHLGRSVGISGDYAIAGVPFELGDIHVVGSAYIFAKTDSGWVQSARLEGSDTGLGALFGHSVAIQGDVAMVGAIGASGIASSTGAVYVYQLINNEWEFVQKLADSDGVLGSQFGLSIAFENDCAVIGTDGGSNESGKVYFFRYNGISWQETGSLSPPESELRSAFGSDVALSNGSLAVGSVTVNPQSGMIFSSAYLYDDACAAFTATHAEEPTRTYVNQAHMDSNFPNPFSLQTTISFTLSTPGFITTEIYNAVGQRVKTITSGELTRGEQQVTWNRLSDDGSRVVNGVYFYSIKKDGQVGFSRPMVVR